MTGTLALPAQTNVKTGINYGANGSEFTGTYAGSIVYTNADNLILRSGQITSYWAEDDGIYRKGYTGGYTNANGSWNGATRFTNHGNGTVTDKLTGLMWTQNANQGPGMLQWTNALNRAADCNAGAYNDWRLPSVRESHSLVDYGRFNPVLPLNHPFIGVKNLNYWTSSTVEISTVLAWRIAMNGGNVDASDKDDVLYVWYVRAGQ